MEIISEIEEEISKKENDRARCSLYLSESVMKETRAIYGRKTSKVIEVLLRKVIEEKEKSNFVSKFLNKEMLTPKEKVS